MKELKVALIGCGRIGFLLENDPLRYKPCTHYGGAVSAGLRINYACDTNTDRLRKFAEEAKISGKNLYTDYRELIRKEKPGMTIIATWTDSHADIGIFAAENGARVIICEKPIAADLKDAGFLLRTCEKKNVALIVNHERRYDAGYRAVKKMLDDNKIGSVKTVYALVLTQGKAANVGSGPGGGVLLHDGTHMIDIIRYLFGDITRLRGEIQREKGKSEDRATAWMKTASGTDLFLEAAGSRDYFTFELRIFGTQGEIIIGNGYRHLYLTKKSKYYTGFRDLCEKPFPKTDVPNYFRREYMEAKKALKDRNTPLTSSGYDAYKALETIHAIYLSSYLQGEEVKLPLKAGEIDLRKIFGKR